jgi:antitoxin (DNA-binding transcriptional repressor) of toxin-antitoxin stability system
MQANNAEAKARLFELVQKAMLGEDVVISRDNMPLLRPVPLEPLQGARMPGTGKRDIFAIAADFDRTPADFEGYR